jgi:hypothetical protein
MFRYPKVWESIQVLWEEAAKIYSDKIGTSHVSKDGITVPSRGSRFATVLKAAEEVLRKHISTEFKLQVLIPIPIFLGFRLYLIYKILET